MLTVKSHTK